MVLRYQHGALARLVEDYPRYEGRCIGVNGHEATVEVGAFEVVVSVEVIEHVEDLRHYLQDVYRLLKPGGKFIWTTPCGNRCSIEHLYALVTQQIDVTSEGSRRWSWEDLLKKSVFRKRISVQLYGDGRSRLFSLRN